MIAQQSPYIYGLAQEVAFYLGYGATELADLPQNKQRLVISSIAAGLRQAYFPPAVGETPRGYEWSFIRQTGLLYAWGTTTGAVTTLAAHSSGGPYTTITVDDDVLYETMVGFGFVFDTSGNSYTITEIVGTEPSTQCVVSGDATGESSTDDYTITANGNYRLPDNFGTLDGPFRFDNQQDAFTGDGVDNVGENIVVSHRQVGEQTGRPVECSVRPIGQVPAEMGGTRFEVMFYPTPDRVYNLTYRYIIQPNMLTRSNPYPEGGAMFADAVLSSCISAAEFKIHDTHGEKHGDFLEKLNSAVLHDRRRRAPDTLGYNGDREVSNRRLLRHQISGVAQYDGW